MEQRIEQKREQLAELCRQHRVLRLTLFGSALREDFDPERSDLDFLVEFEPLPTGTYADTYFGLLEALEHLF
jgi:predicted nucleotidyltransferase